MLSFLKITNLAILDDVSIEPGPGLNVLTGETGAGKSIIVDAIGLILGERGSTDLVRTGCDRLVVEAQFDLSRRTDLAHLARITGIEELEGGELVIRRELLANGRGRCLVNGRMVTLATLKTLGEALADLHGQHQHQSLLHSEGQQDALDRFAGALETRRDVAASCAVLRQHERERDDLAGRERERARRQDTLSIEISEIEAAAIRPGEDEELHREESLLRHAEEIARLATRGFTLLSEDDDSVMARLAGAEECAARLAAIDPHAAELLDAIREARAAASEAARGLSRYVDREEFDPARLEQVAARLSELDRLRRKYGASLADILEYHARAVSDLAALGGVAARLEELEGEIVQARARYLKQAGDLSTARSRAARRLEKAVEQELKSLAMDGTRMEIEVERSQDTEPSPHGMDSIVFLIAPNRGEEMRQLSRIASGGELSRLMLAVRNAAQAGRTDERTLVFDEVDSGIGGQVAEVVGQRLGALGCRQQVLCVTHLPQIASFADRHFQVTKKTTGARTRAEVLLLDDAGRIDELARMLGGSPLATARRHAAALLNRPERAPAGARRKLEGER
ncbi:MAG TPA: DNA repair protein RecN [Patescibacteria group bacterium]|nr:DNA repair protein RecN [Patescibacteria group bacterium]